jgi:hypothetical protein
MRIDATVPKQGTLAIRAPVPSHQWLCAITVIIVVATIMLLLVSADLLVIRLCMSICRKSLAFQKRCNEAIQVREDAQCFYWRSAFCCISGYFNSMGFTLSPKISFR